LIFARLEKLQKNTMIEAHKIGVQRTAHFYTLGIPGANTRYWVIACHGYGQLAKNFIRKFDAIASEDTFILAPEALSTFYWQGFTGDPVASWMTKENRLDEIEDYCRYLSQVHALYRPEMPADVKIILFGFSQGCATVLRWIFQDQPEFQALVLWAGMMPEDLDYATKTDLWKTRPVYYIYGSEDQFITPERLAQFQTFFADNQLPVEERNFVGPHTVDRTALAAWFEDFRHIK
jgi:predicted esterase